MSANKLRHTYFLNGREINNEKSSAITVHIRREVKPGVCCILGVGLKYACYQPFNNDVASGWFNHD